MAVILVKNQTFPISPNPDAGEFYLGVDAADNAWKKQDSTGTVFTLEGSLNINSLPEKDLGNPLDYCVLYDPVLGAHRKVLNQKTHAAHPTLVSRFQTDFILGLDGLTTSTQGTGASVQVGTYGFDSVEQCRGVYQFDIGTAVAGRSAICGVSDNLFKATGDRYRFGTRAAIEQLPTGAQDFRMNFGFGDRFTIADSGNTLVGFDLDSASPGGRWQFKSRVAAVDVQTVDTGVVADLVYHRFDIDWGDVSARGYIDGNLVATILTANLPTGASNLFNFGVKMRRVLGGTNASADVDTMFLEYLRGAER